MQIIASDGSVIAAGTQTGGDVSSWTLASVDLTYSDISKKAEKIYISFKSSSAATPAYRDYTLTVADNKEYSGCNIGSILYVDDLELIYE